MNHVIGDNRNYAIITYYFNNHIENVFNVIQESCDSIFNHVITVTVLLDTVTQLSII